MATQLFVMMVTIIKHMEALHMGTTQILEQRGDNLHMEILIMDIHIIVVVSQIGAIVTTTKA